MPEIEWRVVDDYAVPLQDKVAHSRPDLMKFGCILDILPRKTMDSVQNGLIQVMDV
jgi:hypothetical protein